MSLRVLVFDADQQMRELLTRTLSARGYQVQAFADPSLCPLYKTPTCLCPRTLPCADVILSAMHLDSMSGLDLLLLQRKRGCKAPAANKALIDELSPMQRRAVEALGGHCLPRPFKMHELFDWLQQCEARLASEPAGAAHTQVDATPGLRSVKP